MLLRLRQSCCHCSLVKYRDPTAEPGVSTTQDELGEDVSLDDLLARFRDGGAEEEDVVSRYGREVLGQIEGERGGECPICAAEPMVMEAVTVGCWHMACRQCIIQHIEVPQVPLSELTRAVPKTKRRGSNLSYLPHPHLRILHLRRHPSSPRRPLPTTHNTPTLHPHPINQTRRPPPPPPHTQGPRTPHQIRRLFPIHLLPRHRRTAL
jgi:hypothetical protein